MGLRSSYAPGAFSWTDLATTDQADAKRFYGGLFGWEAQDMPVGDGVFYSMMSRDGHVVGAIAPQPQAQRDAGAPPSWQSYVTVASADEAAQRASAAGGNVHAPPFDVFDAGRMAVIQDPQGAFFMVWEPGQTVGAELVNAPGALTWNELYVPDLDAAQAFYGAVFGWSFAPMEGTDTPYSVISNAGHENGGILPPPMAGIPPHWLVYFGTEDIDAGLAAVTDLGGSVLNGPIDIGTAKIGVVADPQGAMFALYDGRFDD
jgi:predicted enzyme related to lactoylglutathione lyase